jgi:hypothetical protein
MYLHEGLDLDAAQRFWSEVTGIPPAQFSKPYRATPSGGPHATKHEHGCPAIRYSCRSTLRAILGLCDGLLS